VPLAQATLAANEKMNILRKKNQDRFQKIVQNLN